ncbi:MAG TPA: hypothetical protein VGL99_03720 [Chloroflexota bacterium]|jgi:hypothetical protein
MGTFEHIFHSGWVGCILAMTIYHLTRCPPGTSHNRVFAGATFASPGREYGMGGKCHPTVVADGSGGLALVAGSPSRSRRFGSS